MSEAGMLETLMTAVERQADAIRIINETVRLLQDRIEAMARDCGMEETADA